MMMQQLSCSLEAPPIAPPPYPALLNEVGEHDDAATLLLPDHPPEVVSGIGQGTLRSNVRIPELITLQGKG